MRYKSLPPSVRHASLPTTPAPRTPSPTTPSPRRVRDILATIPIVLLLPALLLPFMTAQASIGGRILASPAELAVLPTTGSAWTSMKAVADADPGLADLTDQDNKHAVKTLAIALVGNRLDSDTYRARARAAIMSAIGTERVGADNSILALGRQLGAYVLAADLIGLSGPDDSTFRSWVSAIRTRELGGHGRYTSLRGTCEDSPHNWGTFACASLVAANIYLGDTAAVTRSWAVFRGLTGDRTAYAGFEDLASDVWACPGKPFTPANNGCPTDTVRFGAFVKDVTRGDDPPVPTGAGLSYTLEILQGVAFQAELLGRAGYTGAWDLLRPAFDWARRYGALDVASVGYHLDWWANERLGMGLPTRAAGYGRLFGFTDWLYGSPLAGTVPVPTPTTAPTTAPTKAPTAAPTTAPSTPRPTATPGATPTAGATATPLPTGTPAAAPTASPAAPSSTPAPAPTATAAPTPKPTPEPTDPSQGLGSVGSAAASVVGSTAAANGTAADLTLRRPAKAGSGDLLVAAIDARGKPRIQAPAGWDRVRLDANGTVLELAIYVRRVTSGEPDTYTWGFDKAQAAAGVIIAVDGASSDPVADSAGQANPKSRSIQAPAARADRDASLILGFYATGRVATITAPEGMSKLDEASSGDGQYKTTLMAAAASSDAGAVGSTTARASGAAASVGTVVIIRP